MRSLTGVTNWNPYSLTRAVAVAVVVAVVVAVAVAVAVLLPVAAAPVSQ